MINKIKYSIVMILAILISSNSYAQTGPKTKIRLFDQTTVFDSVVNKNDSLYIYAGDTVFKTELKDADFFKAGTTSAPTDINDSVYTFGNVGFGVNNTPYRFHVSTSGNTNSLIVANNGRTGIGTTTLSTVLNVGGDKAITFQGAGTSLIRANTELRLLAGTGTLYNMHFYGEEFRFNGFDAGTNSTVNMKGRDSAHVALTIGANVNQTNNLLEFVDNTNSPITAFDEVGRLGIGITNPTNQLHIDGGANPIRALGLQPTIANDTSILITNPSTGVVRYIHIDSIKGEEDADFYKVGTTSSPTTINDSIYTLGPVGINTATPDLTLDVNGPVSVGKYESFATATAVIDSTYGDRLFLSGASLNTDPLWIARYNVTNDRSYMRFVAGDNANTTDAFQFGQTSTLPGGFLSFMHIGTNGNVGIGTTTPSNQLHIAGGTNPLRTEGLQPATANDSTVLVVDPINGTIKYLDLDSIGGSDNDWYEQGTTSAPNDISDSIFTGGDVQITNYPNTRADDTTTHLNVLYTDVTGNIKSARREINPPAVALNVSTVNSGNTFNYYNHYATQMTNVGLSPILVGSLDFYVLYYDTAIFANVSISPVGVLSYDVISTSASHAVIDVRFYTK